MQATLIGYFPLATLREPLQTWVQAPNVVEIASAGGCISAGPERWIEQWLHNPMFLYNSEDLAWSLVPPSCRPKFEMYAYRIFPVLYVEGQAKDLSIPSAATASLPGVAPDPLPASFRLLGYDAVSIDDHGGAGKQFGHAPLSCNRMAATIPVNRHCLLDEREEAFRIARQFSMKVTGVEPGAYAVVQVYRRVREPS